MSSEAAARYRYLKLKQAQTSAPMPEEASADAIMESAATSALPQSQLAAATTSPTPQQQYDAQPFSTKIGQNVLNTMGGINKGAVFDMIDMPSNLVNLGAMGLNKIGAIDPYRVGVPTEMSETLGSLKDATTQRFVPKGASMVSDGFRTGAEWLSGGYPSALRSASKGIPAVVADTSVDRAAAGGAVAGEALTTLTDIPYLEESMGLIGGLTGGRGGANPKPSTVDKKAVDAITRNFRGDIPETLKTLENARARGETGTIGNLTDDAGAFGVENAIANVEGNNLKAGIADVDAKRMQEVVDEFSEVIPETSIVPLKESTKAAAAARDKTLRTARDNTVTKTTDDTQALVSSLRSDADAATDAATNISAKMPGAEESARAFSKRLSETPVQPKSIADSPYLSDASIALKGEQQRLSDELNAVVKAEWAKVEGSPPLDVREAMRAVVGDFKVKHMPLNAQGKPESTYDFEAMKGEYSGEIKRIDAWLKNPVRPTEIQSVLRDVKEKVNAQIHTNGKPRHIDIMASDLIAGVEDALMKTPAGSGWRKAVQATKARYDRALPEKIPKLMKDPAAENYGKGLGFTGERGAVTARLMDNAEDAGLTSAAQDMMRSIAKNQEHKGGVTKSFMGEHEGYLKDNPELKAEIGAEITNKAKVDAAVAKHERQTAEAKSADIKQIGSLTSKATASNRKADSAIGGLKKSVDAINSRSGKQRAKSEKRVIARYAKDPVDTLTQALKSGTSVGLKDLKQMKAHADNTGNADALRSHVSEVLQKEVFNNPTGRGLAKATDKSVKAFAAMRDNLVESGVLTKAEADMKTAALDNISTLNRRATAASPIMVKQTLSGFEKTLASLASTMVAVPTSGAASLALHNRLRAGAEKALMAAKNDPKVLARVEEFILNPDKFLAAAEGAKTVEKASQNVLQKMFGTTGRGLDKAVRFRQTYSQDEQEQR